MKIILVSAFYSEGMGYCENSLPKALAALGHEVHLITSNLNVYGNLSIYNETYKSFLGPADQGVGKFRIDGYTVHRLPSKLIFGYVHYKGLPGKIRELSPDIVHSFAIESIQTFILAAVNLFVKFRFFAETHQHLSVVKLFLKKSNGQYLKVLGYRLTRTLPGFLASLQVEKCYAIAPDCALVANKYYGVPLKKLKIQHLGTDTDLFKPATTVDEIKTKRTLRKNLGYSDNDIVCIYTGRFSHDKNPHILAMAIDKLSGEGFSFKGLFIGEGVQTEEILNCSNVKVMPFVKHNTLAEYYKIADIAVWPTQESMSMLDAASSGLPLVVSDKIGESDRIEGNGKVYKEGNLDNLCEVLKSFISKQERISLGTIGRVKMVKSYSWNNLAKDIEKDYNSCFKDCL